MCSGSYRHRQCCYLCKAISHTVDEDESQGLIYTYYGRDAEYRQVQLGCIDIPGPWLHPIARHESEDGNYRWFHWNQWRNTFHDDSWIHSLEMFGSTLVATWLFVSTSVSFQFWSVRNLSWPSPYTGLDDISWPLCKLVYAVDRYLEHLQWPRSGWQAAEDLLEVCSMVCWEPSIALNL